MYNLPFYATIDGQQVAIETIGKAERVTTCLASLMFVIDQDLAWLADYLQKYADSARCENDPDLAVATEAICTLVKSHAYALKSQKKDPNK